MYVADVMICVAIASGFVVGLPALWMLSRGLWPEGFERRCEMARKGVGKSFMAGLIVTFLLVVVMVLLGAVTKRLANAGPIPLLLISMTMIVWGLNGVVGVASLIGERLWPSGEPWKQTRNGGLVVICCALIPVVGWFLFLPVLAVLGLGVNVRCLLNRPPAAKVEPPVPESAHALNTPA